jgi:hypothetical protein
VTLTSRFLSVVLFAAFLPSSVAAQARPDLEVGSGVMVVSFATPDGVVRAYVPDDVAPGEPFSGSVSGPEGYSVRIGSQRANTGGTFQWTAPGTAGDPIPMIFARRGGADLSSVSLQPSGEPVREAAIKVPALVQAGRSFAIRGPFDGNGGNTRVFLGGAELPLLAESRRKVIVKVPDTVVGPAAFTVQEQRVAARGMLRSLRIELTTAADDPASGSELRVEGLAGIENDVPIDVADAHFYLKADDIRDGTLTLRRRFPVDDSPADAVLVIPQTRREEVQVTLRTPRRDAAIVLAQQHATALRALAFDTVPILAELLVDDRLGTEAAGALLSLDERRGMPLVFESMPQSGLSVQRIGFVWFLDHQESLGETSDAVAHAAALRVLVRISSTTMAELALYTIGMTGGADDFPMLQRFARSSAPGAQGLRSVSETVLARLGSRPHLESIRAELRQPLPAGARYRDGLRVTQLLRKAGLTGSSELVPDICTHIADPVLTEIDISVEPGRSAGNALSQILESSSPLAPRVGNRRSLDQWKAFCRGL